MNKLFYLLSFSLLLSCSSPKQEVDLIIHNAVIYTVDSVFSIKDALAVKDGKIIETNSNEIILNTYTAKQITDANGKSIYPGFIDAHCHFYGYGKGLNHLDLVGTTSFEDVIDRTIAYAKERDLSPEIVKEKINGKEDWIIGRGWDQNDWEVKEFPNREKLDSLFPNTPVILKRIDGHAALVNGAALKFAGIDSPIKVEGGAIEYIPWPAHDKKGNNRKAWILTGMLIDNAVDIVENKIPKPSKALIQKALLKAQTNCLAMGLTTIDDAGLEKNIVDAIDELQKKNELHIRIYAMLTPTEENLDHYLKNGIFKTDKLNVRSFKFYGDGALGSRGACLCKDYSDKAGWKGFLLSDIPYFEKYAKLMAEKGFQMNTHCIGDSAAKVILSIYHQYCTNDKDLRWRIEHAQVIREDNFALFNKNILPSVQPTHATSDMYWVGDRLGKDRVKNAYAYKKLLNNSAVLPLGTDFPVEDISPFKTFYAAVFRKDAKGFPEKGYQTENALSRQETLRGMTIWAAYSNFEEKEKGSLEAGKFADLVMLDTDLMKCKADEVLNTKVLLTYINGNPVYKAK